MAKSGRSASKTTGAMHTMKLTQAWLKDQRNWDKWVALAQKLTRDYVAMWVDYESLIRGGSPHHFVPYERLANSSTRDAALAGMLHFMGSGWNPERVRCAFDSAEDDRIRRKSVPSSGVKAADALLSDAFPIVGPRASLACELWALLRDAKNVATALGYPWEYSSLAPCGGLPTPPTGAVTTTQWAQVPLITTTTTRLM